MILNDLCLKVIFWPVLSQLATLKGLCPLYYQFIGVPPLVILNSTITTVTTTTALPPCPLLPLVCLAGGIRPIPYCPCIDPRLQYGQNNNVIALNQIALPLNYANNINGPSDTMIFSQLNADKRRKRRKKRKV